MLELIFPTLVVELYWANGELYGPRLIHVDQDGFYVKAMRKKFRLLPGGKILHHSLTWVAYQQSINNCTCCRVHGR